MTTEQESKLQLFLIEVKNFIDAHRPNDVPKEASYHIAPDSAWISVEHEYAEHMLPNAQSPHDFAVICERKPPSCHIVLAKI